MTKLQFVRHEIDKQIGFFTTKRNHNRACVVGFGVASASLSALATFAIGATKMLAFDWLPLVALTATSVATVVGVWESVFAYRRLWGINNVALADLFKLKRSIDYALSGTKEPGEDEVDRLFKEYDRIVTEADVAWVKTYATK